MSRLTPPRACWSAAWATSPFYSRPLARICRQGRLDQAAEQSQVSLQIATELRELAVLAHGHLLLAVISLQRGDNPTSAQEAQRGLELYARAGDLAGQGTTHNQIANANFNMGLWTAADQAYRQASEVFEALAAGDLLEAEAQGQQGLVLARELEMENEAGIALRLLGEVALAQHVDKGQMAVRILKTPEGPAVRLGVLTSRRRAHDRPAGHARGRRERVVRHAVPDDVAVGLYARGELVALVGGLEFER